MASRSCSPEGASPIKRRKFSICDKVRKCSGSSSYVNYCGVCNGNHQKSEEDVQYNCDSGFTDLPELRDSKDFMQAAREDRYSDDDNSDASSQNSNLSNMSGMNWKPMASSLNWIHKKMVAGANPREVLNQLSLTIDRDLSEIDDMSLWRILINMFSEPPRRQKLSHVNTLEDVISLLKRSQNIIVLTGAGVSVSCGIPDFRSRDGIYARLAVDFPDLPDPHSMFDINYFYKDPRPFYKFAREIYPGQFKPSPCHRFIKLLENHNKLLRNYTQNIDTLEQIAGIENVIECHGSFATASCTRCKLKVTANDIREDIFKQRIPVCKFCGQDDAMSVDNADADGSDLNLGITARGIMKPDIVFFGEGLPDAFHNGMVEDKAKCDLLIVIGTSLKVRPVGLIPNSLPENVPQILINREPLDHLDFDVELLGDSDVIINQICAMMGDEWKEVCWLPEPLKQTKKLVPADGKWNLNMNTDEKSLENGPNPPTATGMVHSPFPGDTEMCCVDSPSSDDNKIGNHDNQIVPDTKSSDDTYKERHMSIDSAGDSGIGDGSNSIDCTTINPRLLLEDISRKQNMKYSVKCLADLLPSQSYYLELPSRYIFPGAEVCCDEWDNSDVDETSSSSEESDSDSDNCEHEMSRKRRSAPAVISDMCDDSSSYDITSVGPPNKRFKIEDTIAAIQDSEI